MSVVEYERHDGGVVTARGLHIAFAESSLPLIEELAIARTRAFHDLYWCDVNRAMMAQVLACLRAIGNSPNGISDLNDLMIKLRYDTELTVLQYLDDIAVKHVGHHFRLTSLFDSVSEARPTLLASLSVDYYNRIRQLSASERLSFEEQLKNALAQTVPSISSPSASLMVDVPKRQLDLGGQIVVVDGQGQARDALDMSEVLKTQETRLRSLSNRVRFFCVRTGEP